MGKSKLIFVEVACAVLVLLFLYATITKLLSPGALRHDMLNQPFPRWFNEILIWLIPALEIILVLLLIFERTRTAGLWGSFGLLMAFTFYAALILMHFFAYVPCGCGGVIRYLSWPQHLVFNLFFAALALVAVIFRGRAKRYSSVIH